VPAAERTVTVRNRYGLHARPATLFATKARTFKSQIVAAREGDAETVDGKSVLGILSLGLERGATLRISARGDDAAEALAALVDLVRRGLPQD
jgi:phosphotransferase system HPr (HPr) family protein